MSIGKRIQVARKDKGYTQKQLAEKLELATGTIQQYELNKRTPKLKTLQKMAKILNIELTEIIPEDIIKNRLEGAGLEGLQAILEWVYDTVDFNWHCTVDSDDIPEYDGDFDVTLIKKGNPPIQLSKQSFETLFYFVCTNIPVFIKMIEENEP